MVNYKDGKIYTIRSYKTDLIYIGSTCQTLAQRLGKHKTNYKKYLNGKYHYVTSFKIFEIDDDPYIELICKFPCSCKEELNKKEGEYIRLMNCVNKVIPGRTKKEYHKLYYEANKDKIKEYHKEWNKLYYEANKDKIKEYNKEYHKEWYKANKDKKKAYKEANKNKYKCEACNYNTSDKTKYTRHLNSNKHKQLNK